MLFDESPLNDVVESICFKERFPPTVSYEAVIFYGDGDDDYLRPLRVVNEDLISDFTKDFADGRVVSMAITTGKYAYRIFPNQHNLYIELTKYTDPEINKIGGESNNAIVQKFKAVLLDTDDPIADNIRADLQNEFKLDILDFRLVRFQIIDEFVEQLKTIKIGSVYRDCTVADVMKLAIHKHTKTIESKTPFNGIEIYGVPREKKDKQIKVIDGTRLVDLPKYLQKNERGVFSSGMSSFYRNGWWYIWPTYDTSRFSDAEHKITIINVPAIKYSGLESTFDYEGNHLTVLSTGITTSHDMNEVAQLTVGNAGRVANAGAIHENGAMTYDKNKAKYSADKIISEYSVDERKDERFYEEKTGRIKVTDNLLDELSTRSIVLGTHVYTVWENSFAEAVIPGMAAKFVYWDGNKVIEKEGVVLATHTFTQPTGGNILRGRYVAATGILLFINKNDKDKS